jgi:hypothetical protein
VVAATCACDGGLGAQAGRALKNIEVVAYFCRSKPLEIIKRGRGDVRL